MDEFVLEPREFCGIERLHLRQFALRCAVQSISLAGTGSQARASKAHPSATAHTPSTARGHLGRMAGLHGNTELLARGGLKGVILRTTSTSQRKERN